MPASFRPVQQPGCLLQAFKGIGLPGMLSPLSDDKRSSSASGHRAAPRRDSSKGDSILSSSPSMQFSEQHIAPAPSGITRTGGWGLDASQFGNIFGDRDGVEDGAEPTSSGGFSNPSPAHSADFARCAAAAVCPPEWTGNALHRAKLVLCTCRLDLASSTGDAPDLCRKLSQHGCPGSMLMVCYRCA